MTEDKPTAAGSPMVEMATLPTIEELGLDLSSESLPQFTDPFMQQYLSGRDAFLEREESTRSDYGFRQSLTPIARMACSIVSRIRTKEHKSLWADDPTSQERNHLYPGMPFSMARERMEQGELWKIVRRLPKGGILHAHFDAMLDIKVMLKETIACEGMGFKASVPLVSREACRHAEIVFRYIGKEGMKKAEQVGSIWTKEYTPDTFVLLEKVVKGFPAKELGIKDFETLILSRATITPEEALDVHTGTAAIWAKFASCFTINGSMCMYEPVFRAAIRKLFAELLEDGVRWVDLRYAFMLPFYREGHTEPEPDHVATFQAFDEELGRFQASPEGERFWGARFIWTGLRFLDNEGVMKNMASCIQHKAMFPYLISAYDLVGHEDPGRTLLALLPCIFWFRKASAAAGLNIPFCFHAGETLETGSATAKNMLDAVLLGTRRLGHAFALYKHPALLESVKGKHICVEACPLSNEVLRLTHSVMAHPLPALLARGVKCTISNDDPSVLGGPEGEPAHGTSRDMWSALQAWHDLGLAGLGSLCEESVRYALFEPSADQTDETAPQWLDGVKKGANGQGVRAERMREWRAEWEKFCAWVVETYAVEYGSDDEEAEKEAWEE